MRAVVDVSAKLFQVFTESEAAILEGWLTAMRGGMGSGRISDNEVRRESREFLSSFIEALKSGSGDVDGSAYGAARRVLADVSASRAAQGFSPSDTARFVFSLKEPLFVEMRKSLEDDAVGLAESIWQMGQMLDRLGLYTTEVYQKSREEVIIRQQQEIAELSTPVVKLWDGVLALPLIGTLDSARTQVIMENLLQAVVDEEADMAIIDITGVPTVDTLVAQHLLKTIAAARLMGADCIISGIRPQIAQTMVHLGVELNVISKATLADAFGLALRRTGKVVVSAAARA